MNPPDHCSIDDVVTQHSKLVNCTSVNFNSSRRHGNVPTTQRRWSVETAGTLAPSCGAERSYRTSVVNMLLMHPNPNIMCYIIAFKGKSVFLGFLKDGI